MPVPQKAKPIVVGIIVDVSSSMSENWKNKEGRALPRIAIIKDSINKQLLRISTLYNLKDNKNKKAEIFCLGLGFRLPLFKYNKKFTGSYHPLATRRYRTITHLDSVCDILALSEIMPNHIELGKIEQELNKKWNGYAHKILAQADISNDVYQELRIHIGNSLFETAHDSLIRSVKYRIYSSWSKKEPSNKSIFLSLPHRMLEKYIAYWKNQIDNKAFLAGGRYFETILRASRKIFERNKRRYERHINRRLELFVAEQAEDILSSLAIGYNVSDVVSLFEEQKAYDLAKEIYDYLDKDIRRKISFLWMFNNARLFLGKSDIRGRLQFKQVDKLTESCIRKCTWELLEPLVKSVVHDLFAKSFKQQTTIMLPYWISLASSREVTRTIGQIANAFPDVYEENFYSSDYLFGNTPMIEALDRASARLLDGKYKNWMKVLVIISDGEFTDSRPIDASERLRKKGVKIIGCCVADKDITHVLTKHSSEHWPDGALALFRMCSIIDSEDDFEQRISKIITGLPEGVKMFFQTNDSEVLEQIFNVILVDEELVVM